MILRWNNDVAQVRPDPQPVQARFASLPICDIATFHVVHVLVYHELCLTPTVKLIQERSRL